MGSSHNINRSEVTVITCRVPTSMVADMDKIATDMGLDRSSFVRWLLNGAIAPSLNDYSGGLLLGNVVSAQIRKAAKARGQILTQEDVDAIAATVAVRVAKSSEIWEAAVASHFSVKVA